MGRAARERYLLGLLPWATAASLLLSCVLITRRQGLWFDEIVTLVLLRDGSTIHLLRAIADGAEGSPPFYHLIARAWAAIFGATPLSLRLFSSAGFAAAALAAYRCLRRYYEPVAAGLAVAAVFAGSELIIHQSAQIRYYGLFMLEAVLAVWALCVVLERTGDSLAAIGWGPLAGVCATHVALLYTHVFGVPYSAALLAGYCAAEFLARGRVRMRPVIAIALAWVAFLPWLPAFAAQREMSRPSLWIPAAGPRTVAQAYGFEISILPLFLIALVVGAVLAERGWVRRPNGAKREDDQLVSDRIAPLALAVALLTVPLGATAISYVVTPLFLPRYLLPSALGLTVMLAEVATRLGIGARDRDETAGSAGRIARVGSRLVLALAACMSIAMPVFVGVRTDRVGRADAELAASLSPELRDLPVAFESSVAQSQPWFDAGRPRNRYVFIVDSAAALDPAAAAGGISTIKLMRALERAGYVGPLADAAEFVRSHDRFIVADRPETRFFERRLRDDQAWTHCFVGTYRISTLWLVARRGEPLTGCREYGSP